MSELHDVPSLKDAIGAMMARHEAAMAKPHYGTMNITEPDRTCLSWWFPKLVDAGLPVPETRCVALNHGRSIGEACFDHVDNEMLKSLAGMLIAFANEDRIGWPCFLRTGHFSGKHDWERTCFVRSPDEMFGNIFRLANMQECAGCCAKNSLSVWVVRRMLPTKTIVRCQVYGGFPMTREIRVFVDGDRVAYTAPYWPADAIEDGKPEHDEWTLDEIQAFTEEELADVTALASMAGAACGGRWSVDVLDTEEGWYVTDMAVAESSYGFDEERFGGTA